MRRPWWIEKSRKVNRRAVRLAPPYQVTSDTISGTRSTHAVRVWHAPEYLPSAFDGSATMRTKYGGFYSIHHPNGTVTYE